MDVLDAVRLYTLLPRSSRAAVGGPRSMTVIATFGIAKRDRWTHDDGLVM